MDGLVGFRFDPFDQEIIRLLKKKRLEPEFSVVTIKEINFYDFEPWELPGFSGIQSEEEVWWFFCEPYHKYAKSERVHRRTKTGYWKVTGRGSTVKSKNTREEIGAKKILSFCCRSRGTASKKANSEWVMYEFAVKDSPLYKKNFVVCRLERKRASNLGVSTSDEDQSSPDLASCSNLDVTKEVFSDLPPLDQNMVSISNHVVENSFSEFENLISCFRDHVAENISSVSQVFATEDLISCSRNHVAENIFAESQLLPSHGLVSYSRNHAAEITAAESRLLASQSMASYTANHVAEISSQESQQLANPYLISCSRNHVAENSSKELHPVPNDHLEWLKILNQPWVSCSTNNVEYTFEAEPQLLAEFNPHGGYDRLNNDSFLALQSPVYPEQEPSYSNGSSCGSDLFNFQIYSDQVNAENICAESQLLPSHSLVSYSRNHAAEITAAESRLLVSQGLASYTGNHVAEITSQESQQLANPCLISCSRYHVAENSSKELHPVPNDNLEWLKIPNQLWVSCSTNNVEFTFEAEPQLLAEFNPHTSSDRLNDASFLALQSLVYPEQETSYSNGSRCGSVLLNSQIYNDQVDDLFTSLGALQSESSYEGPGHTFTRDFNSSMSDEYSYEATGQTCSPNFNTSKSDGGVNAENSSDMDTETLRAWDELSELIFT